MNFKDWLIGVVTDVKDGFMAIAPLIFGISLVGLGIMYSGSFLPGVADWKREHPKAAVSLVMGMAFFAATGLVGTIFPQ